MKRSTRPAALSLFLLAALAATACKQPATPPPVQAPPKEPPPASRVDVDSGWETAATEASPKQPKYPENEVIAKLSRSSEQVRQLRFKMPVEVEVEDAKTISESLIAQIEEEDLERARIVYAALGLLDPKEDLRSIVGDVVSEQVVGYYDPESKRLVVRDDVLEGLMRNGGAVMDENRSILIHELVHALEDQHLGLGENFDLERTSDEENAYRCVVEGDAMLAMVAHALQGQGIPLSTATAGLQRMGPAIELGMMASGEKLDEAPAIIRVTLVAPYLRGLQFVAAVQARGGWAAVNETFASPPTTSEQVLHPEKFFARERGERVQLPAFAGLESAGFEAIEEDTLGELEMGVFFGQDRDSGVDEEAAAGWAGDQLRVYALGYKAAVVWWSTWDTHGEAEQAAAAARRVSPMRGDTSVERRGRAVAITRGIPAELDDEVRGAFAAFATKVNARPAPSGLPNAAP
jgi:hypothetical protein